MRTDFLSLGFVLYLFGFHKLFCVFFSKFNLEIVVDIVINDVFDKLFANAFFGCEFIYNFSYTVARFVEKQKRAHILGIVDVLVAFGFVNRKIDFVFMEALVVKFVLAFLLGASRPRKVLHKSFVCLFCSLFIERIFYRQNSPTSKNLCFRYSNLVF